MEGRGLSGSQSSSRYPPTTYASPAVVCLVQLVTFLRRTGCIRRWVGGLDNRGLKMSWSPVNKTWSSKVGPTSA